MLVPLKEPQKNVVLCLMIEELILNLMTLPFRVGVILPFRVGGVKLKINNFIDLLVH